MPKGIEYWVEDASYPRKVHLQTGSFKGALHKAVEKSERSNKQVNVNQYKRDRDGFWGATGETWKVKVS